MFFFLRETYRFILPGVGKLKEPGTHSYTLVAMDENGQVAQDAGWIKHDVEINSNLPLGHTLIKGVDIYDGHLIRSSQDVVVPGRGLSLDFTRTYSSQGHTSGRAMGAGWTFSYDVRLFADELGILRVIGGEGTGNRFGAEGETDAAKADAFGLPATARFYKPQIGYHSTLVQPDPDGDPDSFDFYTKNHVRYHFELKPDSICGPAGEEVYTLRFIEEPNGNRIDLFYDYYDAGVATLPPLLADKVDGDTETLDVVVDSSNRALILEYSAVPDAETETSPSSQDDDQVPEILRKRRIIRLTGYDEDNLGLLGLDVRYDYNSVGNLIQVTREGLQTGSRVETYTYTPGFDESAHNMLSYTDPNGNVTRYEYLADTGSTFFSYPDVPPEFGIRANEFVSQVIEPGGKTGESESSITTFTYNITSPGTPSTRVVSDPRSVSEPTIPPTVYTLNGYGATEKIEAPLGKVTMMEWATPGFPQTGIHPGFWGRRLIGLADGLTRTSQSLQVR